MRVRFQPIESPARVLVRENGDERFEEIWPIQVELEIQGTPAPLHFAWDRYHGVLYVDERWRGRGLLGDLAAAEHAAMVARDVLQRSVESVG